MAILKMKSRVLAVIFPLLCSFLMQCTNKNRTVEEYIVNSFDSKVDSCIVDLSQLPFVWDSVFFFSSRIDSPPDIKRITGIRDYTTIGDPGTRIVFVHKGHLVYEECWLTTSYYSNYIYYENNDSYIMCLIQDPLFVVKRVINNSNNQEYYLIRNIISVH